MNKFKRGSAVVLAGLTLWTASSTTYGLGLGHPVSRAILGDTLSVSVPVRLDAGEELSADCVKADVYFGDDKVPAPRVQTQLNHTTAPMGRQAEQVIQVRTSALINEPVVTVYVTAGCQTKITRKLVALVDPPDLRMPVAGAAASQSLASSGSEPEPSTTEASAPIRSQAQPVKLVQDPVSRSSGLGRKAPSFALSEGEPPQSSKRKARTPRAAASKKSKLTQSVDAPRLVVDPVATDANVAPGLQMSGQLGAVTPEAEASSPEVLQRRRSAAAIWQAMNASPEEMARDQARLEDLERKLDGLSRDSARASEAVTGLQSRLAHQSVGGNGVAYGLGALVALLLGVLVWREWTLRKALAEQSSWLTSQSPEDSAPAADDSQASAAALPDIQHVLADIDAEIEQARASSQLEHSVERMAPNLGQDTSPAPIHDVPAPVAPRAPSMRDVSVDELIDLEQQAEFFLVLGQDESAIELLEAYISNSTALSPMPFLKLLEIYRQMGMRTAYERTRMNFNLRFNAHAALWEADLTHGHELKDYPGVVERLQALWAYPDKALEVLERSLMRQDAESYTFDLPAYRELLFLYAILRDLQGQPQSAHDQHHLSHMDLLVSSSPSGRAAGGEAHPGLDADLDLSSPLMATLPMKALPDLAPTLSLDLELDDLYVDPASTDHKP